MEVKNDLWIFKNDLIFISFAMQICYNALFINLEIKIGDFSLWFRYVISIKTKLS